MPAEDKYSSQIQATQPERPVRDESLAAQKGEAGGTGRIRVRITSRRNRLVDPDNLCPKYFIDALRYCKALPDDREADIDLSCRQEKVPRAKEETLIEVEYPDEASVQHLLDRLENCSVQHLRQKTKVHSS
tara:strand:+ start:914 stop:1306 length:393 start_codon:yes stop_codon:yes gene_type:complete